jgi:hypothetical protein
MRSAQAHGACLLPARCAQARAVEISFWVLMLMVLVAGILTIVAGKTGSLMDPRVRTALARWVLRPQRDSPLPRGAAPRQPQ